MPQGTGTGASSIKCDSCGKQFRWREEIAGKRMKCPCGGVVTIPADPPAGAAQQQATGAGPRVNAAAIMAAKGLPPPRGKTRALKELETAKSGQEELEEMAKTNLLRDIVIPIPIIIAGLILSYLNVTRWPMPGKPAAATHAQAISMVLIAAVVSVVLVVGAIFLTTVLADVTFVGKFHNSILRLCAIAIGPSAIYAIMSAVVGVDGNEASMAGTGLGALLTIVCYGLLYWGLMRLDFKDTAVCVMVTFFLVMFSQYMMWRMEGLARGSDI
jgi:hypothetical protein